jgi:xanthine/uracil/vitamin C permease (AzgA family)
MTSPTDSPRDEEQLQQANRLAKLFDLRTFIGTLFLVFGVVVTIEGFTARPADIAKAAGVNLSLWTGLAMLVVGALFIAWMLLSPPELEATHQDLSRPPELGH